MKDKLERHRRRLTPEERDQVWGRIRSGLEPGSTNAEGGRRGWWPWRWQVPVTALGAACVVIIALVISRRSDDVDLDKARWTLAESAEESAQAPAQPPAQAPEERKQRQTRGDGAVAMQDRVESPGPRTEEDAEDAVGDRFAADHDISKREAVSLPKPEAPVLSGELESGTKPPAETDRRVSNLAAEPDDERGEESLDETSAYRSPESASPQLQPSPAPTRSSPQPKDGPAAALQPPGGGAEVEEQLGGARAEAETRSKAEGWSAQKEGSIDAAWSREYGAHPRLWAGAYPEFTVDLTRPVSPVLQELESVLQRGEWPREAEVPVQSQILSAFGNMVEPAPNRPWTELVSRPNEVDRAWLVAAIEVGRADRGEAREFAFVFDPAFVESYRVLGERTVQAQRSLGERLVLSMEERDDDHVFAESLRTGDAEVSSRERERGESTAVPSIRIVVVDLWLTSTASQPGVLWGAASVSYGSGDEESHALRSDGLRSFQEASPRARRAALAGNLGDLLAGNPWARSVDSEWLAGELRRSNEPSIDEAEGGVVWTRVSSLAVPLLSPGRANRSVRSIDASAEPFYSP